MKAAFLLWGSLAVINLAVGWWVAGWEGALYADAYKEVRHWLEIWRSTRADVYALDWPKVDYPPNALTMLVPLLSFPEASGGRWMATLNVAASILCVWLLISVTSRMAGANLTRLERSAYALMLLAWTPVRIGVWNGQVTPILLLFLFASLRLSTSRPLVAGIALGLGAAKPHLMLPFALLLVLQARWRVVATGGLTAVGLSLVYCVSVARSPVTVLLAYTAQLVDIYGGADFLRAELDYRPLFIDALPSYVFAEALYIAVSIVLGVLLCWMAWRARDHPEGPLTIFSTALLLSMAVFPFRRYGLLALAPAVLTLVWHREISRRQLAFLSFVVLSLWIDFPFVLRHAILDMGLTRWSGAIPWFHYINRAIVVTFLVWNFRRLFRLAAASVRAGGVPHPTQTA